MGGYGGCLDYTFHLANQLTGAQGYGSKASVVSPGWGAPGVGRIGITAAVFPSKSLGIAVGLAGSHGATDAATLEIESKTYYPSIIITLDGAPSSRRHPRAPARPPPHPTWGGGGAHE